MPLQFEVLTNLQGKTSRSKMKQRKQASQAIIHHEVILYNFKTTHQLIRKLYIYCMVSHIYCTVKRNFQVSDSKINTAVTNINLSINHFLCLIVCSDPANAAFLIGTSVSWEVLQASKT